MPATHGDRIRATTFPCGHTVTLTAADVASWIEAHPEFFNEHADLLARLSLTSPHGNRAVSLQERQMELLRDKIKALELKLAEMIRFGQENDMIGEKINRLVRQLFLERNSLVLPDVLVRELRQVFALPAVAVRLWGVAIGGDQPYAAPVSNDTRTFVSSLMAPYCGPNSGFEAVNWLPDAATLKSVALIPLRMGATPEAYGLLVLGSPDANRFTSTMGTTYLARIEEIASAALARLMK